MRCRVLRFRCDFMFPLSDCHMKLSASYAMSVAVSFLTFSSQFGLTRFALLNFLAWYCRYLPGQGMERARLELSLHSWIQIYVLTCHIIKFYANGLWCLTAHPPTHTHTWPAVLAPETAHFMRILHCPGVLLGLANSFHTFRLPLY